jgi:hypothetical protein
MLVPDRDHVLRCLSAAVELLAADRADLLTDEKFLEVGRELPEFSGAIIAHFLVDVASHRCWRTARISRCRTAGLAAKRGLWGEPPAEPPPAA